MITPQNKSLFDTVPKYIDIAFRNRSFNAKRGAVNSIIYSSSFDLIQNDSLRSYLVSWNDVLEDYLEEEKYTWDFLFKEVGPWTRANFAFAERNSIHNRKVFFSDQYQNFIQHRFSSLRLIKESVEGEGLMDFIENIIQLTKPENQ